MMSTRITVLVLVAFCLTGTLLEEVEGTVQRLFWCGPKEATWALNFDEKKMCEPSDEEGLFVPCVLPRNKPMNFVFEFWPWVPFQTATAVMNFGSHQSIFKLGEESWIPENSHRIFNETIDLKEMDLGKQRVILNIYDDETKELAFCFALQALTYDR